MAQGGNRSRDRLVTVATCVGVAALLVIAVIEYAGVRWYPVLDDALTELRVRSVWSADPPLIGLPGRIGTQANPGSHLGPLSFYLLWPLYRLFGASSWSLQLSTAAFHIVAVVLTLWMAVRRRGIGLMLGFAAVFVVLISFFGPLVLTEPWNPYLPVLWWVTFVVAVWSTTCGDVVGPPVAALAGSLCMQTHISYAGLVPGLAVVAAAIVVVRIARKDLRWSRAATWSLAVAGGVTVLVWIPPIVDQLTNTPGNLGIVIRYFSDPPTRVLGAGDAMSLMLVHLNPWNVLEPRNAMTGSIVPGAIVLGIWLASAVTAAVRRVTQLALFDVVVAATLVLGTISMARIFGPVSYYLVLWSWGLLALMLLATAWALIELTRAHATASRVAIVVVAAGAVVIVPWRAQQFVDTATKRPLPTQVEQPLLDRLVPETEQALDDLTREHGYRYTMTWRDDLRLGGIGYALFNELRRHDVPVTAYVSYRRFVPEHLLTGPLDANAVLHLAVGTDIARWRGKPGITEVAEADARTDYQKVEFRRLRDHAISTLRAEGLEDLIPVFDDSTFVVVQDPRFPESVRADAAAMVRIGDRAVVFVQPF